MMTRFHLFSNNERQPPSLASYLLPLGRTQFEKVCGTRDGCRFVSDHIIVRFRFYTLCWAL